MKIKTWNTKIRTRILAAGLAGVLGVTICGCGTGVEPSASADAVQEETGREIPEQKSSEQTEPGPEETSLHGEIREISDQSFLLNQIIEKDAGGDAELAALPLESENMTLINVSYDEDTVFTLRTIKSGGEEYEDSESSPETLKTGDIVELQGSYEGEVFHASQVRIETVM